MKLKNEISISYKNLKICGLSFLIIPVIIFLFFFVKRIISVPIIGILFFVLRETFRSGKYDDRHFTIEIKQLVLVFFVCLAWCYLGGQGGFFYQTSDWNERNAIFRDLMTNKWPVYYSETNTALTYYIGHWLPSALIGRTFYTLTGQWDLAWSVGNVSLLLWTTFSVFICMLLLMQYTDANEKQLQCLVIGVMIGFSGLDVVGCVLQGWQFADFTRILHIEWWNLDYQFSSNTTCLFWVYNQAVPAWIATLLFLNEKNNKLYALIISCALLSAPLPCVGLAIYMVGHVMFELFNAIKQRYSLIYLKETFCMTNILPTVFVFPILAIYFMVNSALENSNIVQVQSLHFNQYIIFLGVFGILLVVIQLLVTKRTIPEFCMLSVMSILITAVLLINPNLDEHYILFLILEVGVYLLLIASEEYKNDLLYLTIFIFVLAPTVKVGIGVDFCMRATIPAVIVLTSMCINSLKNYQCAEKQKDKITIKKKIQHFILVSLLIIGTVTPIIEVYRGVYKVTAEQKINLVADEIYTLNQYHSSGNVYGNFVSENYQNSLFYKYIAQP